MKKYAISCYYRLKICQLKKDIKEVYSNYAKRSSMSSRNFEFEHLVIEEISENKKKIYDIKRKMCTIR